MKFISGLANCHLPGLYSFVLENRKNPSNGMRRVFYTTGDCNMQLWDGNDFRLRPHNHRQSITLCPLFGEVSNVRIILNRWGDLRIWRYKFASALLDPAGNFSLERMNSEDGSYEIQPLGSSLFLHWSEIHTVVAAPHSAWMVIEHEEAPPDTARLFSLNHRLELSSKDLYHPIAEEDLGSFGILIDRFIQTKKG